MHVEGVFGEERASSNATGAVFGTLDIFCAHARSRLFLRTQKPLVLAIYRRVVQGCAGQVFVPGLGGRPRARNVKNIWIEAHFVDVVPLCRKGFTVCMVSAGIKIVSYMCHIILTIFRSRRFFSHLRAPKPQKARSVHWFRVPGCHFHLVGAFQIHKKKKVRPSFRYMKHTYIRIYKRSPTAL